MARIVRPESAPRVVPRALVDARTEAEHVREAARTEGRLLIEAAIEEAERRLAEADAEVEALVAERTAALLVELGARRSAMLDAAESELLALAGEIAKRALDEAFELEPALLARHVASALAHARRARRVRLRVPRGAGAELASRLPDTLELVEDDALSGGDCIVESDVGRVDARLDDRVDRLVAALGGRAP
ncbi:MAG: FliH/SctL family protein [Polyangiales bacterium]